MTQIYRDLRESLRVFLKQPGFSAIVVLTLALGIGANTAIFSLIYGILLRPFPYREPDRLVRVQSVLTKSGGAVGPALSPMSTISESAIAPWSISAPFRVVSTPISAAMDPPSRSS
jgi:putative ABC transport system permease protein